MIKTGTFAVLFKLLLTIILIGMFLQQAFVYYGVVIEGGYMSYAPILNVALVVFAWPLAAVTVTIILLTSIWRF